MPGGHKTSVRWIAALTLSCALAALAARGAPAQSARTSGQAAGGRQRITGREALAPGSATDRTLAALLDRMLSDSLRALHVPGAVAAMVHDGRVIFTGAYGQADLERHLPASPDSTLFRLGSISKTVTAVSVMQLVEQGRLSLDDDVNRYLDGFRVDDRFAEPVRIRHLLTHTAGFELRNIGIGSVDPANVQPLATYLARAMPPRQRPPGDRYAYSNYGYALAGYVVERVTGLPFAECVRRHVLEPLTMRSSGFSIAREAGGERLAVSYKWYDGASHRQPTDHYHLAPAMDYSSTAADMARFMIALLGPADAAHRVLSDSGIHRMNQRQYSADPRLNGVTYALREYSLGRVRLLQQGGLVNGFASILMFAPDDRFGLFVACNDPGCLRLEHLSDSLVAVLEPAASADRSAGTDGSAGAAADLDVDGDVGGPAALAGDYIFEDQDVTTIERLRHLFGEVRVTASGDTLSLSAASLRPSRSTWLAAGPGYFRRLDGPGALVVRRDPGGDARLFPSTRGMWLTPLRRLRWYERARTQRLFVLTFGTVLLSGCLAWPALWLRRRLLRLPPVGGRWARFARANTWLACAGLVLFVAAFIYVLQSTDFTRFAYGMPRRVVALLWLLLLSSALAVPVPVYAMVAWRKRIGVAAERAYLTLVALALVAAVSLAAYWRVIGFQY